MDQLKRVKMVFATFMGITLLFFGFLLLFIPGPGILLIWLGLLTLAGEFYWARKILKKLKTQVKKTMKRASKNLKNS